MVRRLGRGEAPAKAILLGEHAVVYGHPALAVPLFEFRARAQARFDHAHDDIVIRLDGRNPTVSLSRQPDNPLVLAVRLALEALGAQPRNLALRMRSTIPVAAGLGSGAAVTAALMRAVGDLFGARWDDADLAARVFEVEKVHHGSPSGIDNTVVTYRRPVYFRKDEPVRFAQVGAELSLLVADTGRPGSTRDAVAAVRRRRETDPAAVMAEMERIGDLVEAASASLAQGDTVTLGRLMDANHERLRLLGVSSPELEALVEAARGAGAVGAKLTGAGCGGHALALVSERSAPAVREALLRAGAARVTLCRVAATVDQGPAVAAVPPVGARGRLRE
ncbi:MAG: mevalonate kinase [Anaerolineae bacterium]|nr:mevalonate kinase [Anaerolineae bacterium]